MTQQSVRTGQMSIHVIEMYVLKAILTYSYHRDYHDSLTECIVYFIINQHQ